ncbi:MAG: tetratricopeptide repeat protein, partial [Terriglobia bacterium]
AMKGAGIKKDERIYGATLLDITPTVLTLFGLPVGEDMDGRVLVQAFEDAPAIERIPSWEQEPGECGMHSADLRMDPESAQAVLNQFAALGYIAPTGDQKKAVESALREAKYNLARVYMDKGQPRLALPMFEDLDKEQPEQARFAQHLAQCYFSLQRIEDAKRVLVDLINQPPRPPKPKEDGDAEAPLAPPEGGTSPAPAAPFAAAVPGEAPQSPTSRPWVDWLMGVILFEEGKMAEALESLLRAEQADPRIPEARLGLATVHLRRRKNEEAVEEALVAVSLQHFLPMGHFCLGVALARLGHFHRAVAAFETTAAMAPGSINAHRWLVAINSRPGGDLSKAAQHRKAIAGIVQRRRAALPQ